MISSSNGKVLALDLHEYLLAVSRLQEKTGLEFDDEGMFEFVLNSMQFEKSAIEELEINLLELSSQFREVVPDLQFPYRDGETTDMLNLCHDYGHILLQELKDLDAYDMFGRLNFKYAGRNAKFAYLIEVGVEDEHAAIAASV